MISWRIRIVSTPYHVEKEVDTGWRRRIGCLKLQVIFRKRAANYRILLRKMTSKDKASYGSSPPCIISLWRGHMPFHTCFIFTGHFPQKSPMISSSFAKNKKACGHMPFHTHLLSHYLFVALYMCKCVRGVYVCGSVFYRL